MTKLTKTETELLRRAKESRHGSASVLVTLSGSAGFRPRSRGTRERNAATSLRVKGLLSFERYESYDVHGYGGSSTHCWESLWSITDAGRNTALEG